MDLRWSLDAAANNCQNSINQDRTPPRQPIIILLFVILGGSVANLRHLSGSSPPDVKGTLQWFGWLAFDLGSIAKP